MPCPLNQSPPWLQTTMNGRFASRTYRCTPLAIRFNVFDVFVMLGAGVLGYVMRIFGVPVAPLLIAFILTRPFEESLRQALIRSEGSLMVFLEHPIALFFLILAVAAVAFTVWREHKTGHRIGEQG